MADFARAIFAGRDLQPTFDALKARAAADPDDAGALLDLSVILQLVGQREQGLALQADALARQRRYRRVMGTGQGPTLLALVAAGDMMANTPVEFLLSGWNGVLELLYVAPGDPPLAAVPAHDVAMLAIGESDVGASLLGELAEALAAWPRPMINGDPDAVLALRRDRAAERLAGHPGIVAPPVRRATPHELACLAANGAVPSLLPGCDWPLIARPIGSHAGTGLERLGDPAELAGYLARQPAPGYYLSPFIDYAGADGRHRKLRVALVAGRPFAVHMAVSEHWMVHYLNAGMAEDAGKRAEEARLMDGFDEGFAARHAAAFRAISAAFGLDYLALDCAEAADGSLLVFEPDTAMIVHDMDPPDLYPYKAPAIRKLFAAFQTLANTLAEA